MDTPQNLIEKIKMRYQLDFNDFIKIFFSLNILGNPAAFVNTVGSGFKDLITLPA